LREGERLAECSRRAKEAGERRYNWGRAAEELLALYRAVGLDPSQLVRRGG